MRKQLIGTIAFAIILLPMITIPQTLATTNNPRAGLYLESVMETVSIPSNNCQNMVLATDNFTCNSSHGLVMVSPALLAILLQNAP